MYMCIICSVISDSLQPHGLSCQAPLSMEFSKQEYWSGLPFPSPGDLPNSRIKPRSPELQADSLPSELPRKIFYLLILNLKVLVVRISVLFIFLSHPVTKLSKVNKYILNAFKWYDHNIQKAKENSDYCDGKICKGNVFCSLCIFTLFFLPILLCSEWFIF